jgi:hypothetical protein
MLAKVFLILFMLVLTVFLKGSFIDTLPHLALRLNKVRHVADKKYI